MAMRRHIRLRAALPTVILLAALAIGLETALSWNVVNIELVGDPGTCRHYYPEGKGRRPLPGQQHHPAGGGKPTGKAGRKDGRASGGPADAAGRTLPYRGPKAHQCRCSGREHHPPCFLRRSGLGTFRTRQGCILRMRVGGQRFITLSGTVRPAKPIRAEWLLASMARPENIRYTDCLTLSSKYRWMEETQSLSRGCASVSRGERFSKRASMIK